MRLHETLWSNSAYDSERLGLLEIENEFDLTMTGLWSRPERKAISSQLRHLTEADLSEMVQIRVSERVKVTVSDDLTYYMFNKFPYVPESL